MKLHHTTITVAALTLSTGLAHANFVDVIFKPVPVAEVGTPAGYTTWRAVARFDDPNDWVVSVYGQLGIVPLHFETTDPAGLLNLPAVEFGAGTSAEDLALAPLSSAWDSYVTIDYTTLVGNDTAFSPAFLGGGWTIRGTSFTEPQGGYFDSNPGNISVAGADLEIVIAQFTVKTGEDVSYSGIMDGVEFGASPGGGQSFTVIFDITSASTCPGDVDGDGVIGFGDVLSILSAWGPCAGCPQDLNGDGNVGFADLVAVLAAWGSC